MSPGRAEKDEGSVFQPESQDPSPRPGPHTITSYAFAGRPGQSGRSPCPRTGGSPALAGGPGVETVPSLRSTWVGRGMRDPVFPFSSGPKGTHWPHLELRLCQHSALQKAQGTVPSRLRSERPVPPGCERGRRAAPGGSPACRVAWTGHSRVLLGRDGACCGSLCSSQAGPGAQNTAPGGGEEGFLCNWFCSSSPPPLGGSPQPCQQECWRWLSTVPYYRCVTPPLPLPVRKPRVRAAATCPSLHRLV